MKLVDTRTSLRSGNPPKLPGKNEPGKSLALGALAACRPTEPVFRANGKRNVPPGRDVEPAILSLAELRSSIRLESRAMQPHGGPIGPTRMPHVN